MTAKAQFEQAQKERACAWRKTIVHLTATSRSIQSMPGNAAKTVGFAMARPLAELARQFSSSELSLQEMLAATEVFDALATAEKEHLAKLGVSGSAEEYLGQQLSQILPMVRELAKAFRQYDTEMKRIHDRLTGPLTVADFHALVAEEARVSATMDISLDKWIQGYPQQEDFVILEAWQEWRGVGENSLENMEALRNKLAAGPSACDLTVATEIKRLQELVDNRPAIRSEYLQALKTDDGEAIRRLQKNLGAFALFADDPSINELEIVQKEKAREAEVRTQKLQKLQQAGACLQRFVAVAEEEIHTQRQDRPQWPEPSHNRVVMALNSLEGVKTTLSEEKDSFVSIIGVVEGVKASLERLLGLDKESTYVPKTLAVTAGIIFAILLPITEVITIIEHENSVQLIESLDATERGTLQRLVAAKQLHEDHPSADIVYATDTKNHKLRKVSSLDRLLYLLYHKAGQEMPADLARLQFKTEEVESSSILPISNMQPNSAQRILSAFNQDVSPLPREMLGMATADALISIIIATVTPVGWVVVWLFARRKRKAVVRAHAAFKESVEQLKRVAGEMRGRLSVAN